MNPLETIRAKIQDITENRSALAAELLGATDADGIVDDATFTRLDGEISALDSAIEKEQARLKVMERVEARSVDLLPGAGFPRDPATDPFTRGSSFEGPSEIRARAAAAIESTFDDADLAQAATDTLRNTEGPEVAEHIILTADPAYRSAFAKHIRDTQTGYQTFSDSEREAWGRVQNLQRGLGLSGAVLPSVLDPTIVLTNAGTMDPMRSMARVAQTTANEKRFITSAGVTASWDGEAAEVSDDTPSLTEKTITTHKAQAFVAASIEAAQDQVNWGAELATMFADAKARLEGTEFVSGAGTAGPKGIWTALDGTASELSPATAEVFVADDVYSTIEDLPVRWRAKAKWQIELSTLNTVHRFFNPSGSEPPVVEGDQILKRPFTENSSVSAYSDIVVTATADHPILILGDWKQYVVLDRIGMTIELVPHLFATANNRPSGQRGWYAFWRVGGDVLTADAFRVMNIATTA